MKNEYEHLPAVEDLTSGDYVYRTRTYTTSEEADAEYLTTGLFEKAGTIKKHDCKAVGTLLLDFDLKDWLVHKTDKSEATIKEMLRNSSDKALLGKLMEFWEFIQENLPIAPTTVVCSGYGFHTYYWLDYDADDFPEVLEVQSTNRSLVEYINDSVDFDLCDTAVINPGERVTRAPGSFNTKGGSKRLVKLVAKKDHKYKMDAFKSFRVIKDGLTSGATKVKSATYEQVTVNFDEVGEIKFKGGKLKDLGEVASALIEAVKEGRRDAGEHLRCACPFHAGKSDDSAFLRLGRDHQPMLSCSGCKMTWRDSRFSNGMRIDEAVSELLDRTEKGKVKPSAKNVTIVLRHDKQLRDKIYFNEMDHNPWLLDDCSSLFAPTGGRPEGRPWQDDDECLLRAYIRDTYNVEIGLTKVFEGCKEVALRNPRHPLRDSLVSARKCWMDAGRPALLDTWFRNVFPEVVDNDLHRAYAKRFLLGMVARIFKPGTKFDNILILVGEQGARKSTFVRELAGDSYAGESHLDFQNNRSCVEQISGAWLYEVAEFDRYGPKEQALLKGFLSVQEDKVRKAYGRHATIAPRTTCFVGTSNKQDILVDETGSRRYWVIEVGEKVDIEWLRAHRDELLGEATDYYMRRKGEDHFLHLTPELEAQRNQHNEEQFKATHELAPTIAQTFSVQSMIMHRLDPSKFTASEVADAMGISIRDQKLRKYAIPQALRELGCTKSKNKVSHKGIRVRVWNWESVARAYTPQEGEGFSLDGVISV